VPAIDHFTKIWKIPEYSAPDRPTVFKEKNAVLPSPIDNSSRVG
jgi:hypothetical protein